MELGTLAKRGGNRMAVEDLTQKVGKSIIAFRMMKEMESDDGPESHRKRRGHHLMAANRIA
jgi:hypothetical protein